MTPDQAALVLGVLSNALWAAISGTSSALKKLTHTSQPARPALEWGADVVVYLQVALNKVAKAEAAADDGLMSFLVSQDMESIARQMFLSRMTQAPDYNA
jgi:hypothetical protein